jgi:hypothetical protein
MIVANPIYDVVFKSIEIKPQKYTFVNDQALDKKKNNPEYFEQFFGANHLDKGLTKIAHEGGRVHGLLKVTNTFRFLFLTSYCSDIRRTNRHSLSIASGR